MVEPLEARAAVPDSPPPRVSVIVPTWNEGKWLPTLLDALRAQTVPPSEIVVADSGSSDETLGIARSAGAIVTEGERRGPGEGRNRGARIASGEILVFVDADCVPPRNLIESVVRALADPTVVGGATGFVPADGRAFERLLFRLANGYQRAMTLWGLPHNAGYCFFFRKAAFERLRGIREDMLLNETHDLAMRSRALGRFVILPVAVETAMRRFRAYGYFRPVRKDNIASTILYYPLRTRPPDGFHPAPDRPVQGAGPEGVAGNRDRKEEDRPHGRIHDARAVRVRDHDPQFG